MNFMPTQITIAVRTLSGRMYPPILDGIACEPIRVACRHLRDERAIADGEFTRLKKSLVLFDEAVKQKNKSKVH
jgi:hypothetical protein